MKRFLAIALFSLTGLLLTTDVASAQWRLFRRDRIGSDCCCNTQGLHDHRYRARRSNCCVPQGCCSTQGFGGYYPSSMYSGNYYGNTGMTWSSPSYSSYGTGAYTSSGTACCGSTYGAVTYGTAINGSQSTTQGYPGTSGAQGLAGIQGAPGASMSQQSYGGSDSPTNTYARPNYDQQNNTAQAQSGNDSAPNNRQITIRHPEDSEEAITFKLNDEEVRLEPGQVKTLTFDRDYTIEFDRGDRNGTQSYVIRDGNFEFERGDRGWDLRSSAGTADSNPQLNDPLTGDRN